MGPRVIGPSAFFISVSSSTMVGANRASSPGPIAPTCLRKGLNMIVILVSILVSKTPEVKVRK